MAKTEKHKVVLDTILNYREEAKAASATRMEKNRENFDFYHLKQNMSHKLQGQSTEFLPKQSMAVEQISSFLHQGIVDLGDWFSANPRSGVKEPIFSADEARKILQHYLDKAEFYTFIEDSLKKGLLGSLMIAKVSTKLVMKPTFFSAKNPKTGKDQLRKRKNKAIQLDFNLIRPKDWFPDPTNEDLYKQQRIEIDRWKMKQFIDDNPKMGWDMAEVASMMSDDTSEKTEEAFDRSRETDQNVADTEAFRRRVEIIETWGDLIDSRSGELLHERVLTIVSNRKNVILPPVPYATWNNEDPFVTAPLVRVPHSVWHRALMDAPTALNRVSNELFNLLIDGGMQAVHGIKQIRMHWLDNPDQISEGIQPGITLQANQACPPGQKVIERVDTANNSVEGKQAFDLAGSEFNTASLTNDLRLGGLPPRAVKATEVVEASQSITSVFTAIGKSLEEKYIQPLLRKAWNLLMQNYNELSREDLRSILGEKREKEVHKIKQFDRFSRTVDGHAFKVFGVTQTLNKMKDFRKLTAVLQTISSDGQLAEAFAQRFDFTKLLDKILTSLDVNTKEIELDQIDQDMNAAGGAGQPVPTGPNLQSQIPQATTGSDGAESENPIEPGRFV